MKCKGLFWLAIICAPLLFSCTSEMPAVSTEPSGSVEYSDTAYCFNGRYIVTAAAGKGIMDENGRIVIDAGYDDIEFLNDDVALLTDSGVFWLATRDGRFFAEDTDPEALVLYYSDLYEGMLRSDALYWDEILDALDRLCDVCIGIKGKRLAENTESVRTFESLKSKLDGNHGRMSETQRIRLEEIEKRFHTYRK